MELSQIASRSRHFVPVAQCRSAVASSCRVCTVGVSFAEIWQSRSMVVSTPGQYGSSMESLVLPGKVQRRVRCGSLQEGQVGSVEEKTALVSRLDGGAEDSWQSGEHDDGLGRAKLAVFVSGGGSNFRAIHAGCKKNAIHGDVAFVVSDKPGCKGVEYAMENNIPVLAYPKGKNAPEGISPTELVENLRLAGVEYILLAGYLRLLPSELVHAYPRAILNIHPALLPSFGGKGFFGMKVHEAVIRSGARYTGATVHYVDEKYDTGPILAQRVVPVRVDDTPAELASRVLKEEHKLYSFAVSALCEDRIFWREDGVPIIRKSWDEAEYL